MLGSVGIGTGPNGPINQMQGSFGGLKITVSEHALETTDERLFPISRHRSNRVFKKLTKRFGGEFMKVPCAYQTRIGVVMHPKKYAEFERQVIEALRQ